MNILLWVLQIVLAFFSVTGSIWRFFNYETAAKDIPSMKALPYGVWNTIGVFEIICAVGLILPGILKLKPAYIGIAGAALAIELLLISGLHLKYFGFQMKATNPAVWSMGLCMIAAFVAYGRLK